MKKKQNASHTEALDGVTFELGPNLRHLDNIDAMCLRKTRRFLQR